MQVETIIKYLLAYETVHGKTQQNQEPTGSAGLDSNGLNDNPSYTIGYKRTQYVCVETRGVQRSNTTRSAICPLQTPPDTGSRHNIRLEREI